MPFHMFSAPGSLRLGPGQSCVRRESPGADFASGATVGFASGVDAGFAAGATICGPGLCSDRSGPPVGRCPGLGRFRFSRRVLGPAPTCSDTAGTAALCILT